MKMKVRLANWLMHHLSQPEEAGEKVETNVPGDWLRYEFGEADRDNGKPMFIAHTSNDGFELWIAYNGGKWLWHCRHEDARRLAWWILWDWWGKATWFGLRRRIWYWALHAHLMGQDWYRERYGNDRT